MGSSCCGKHQESTQNELLIVHSGTHQDQDLGLSHKNSQNPSESLKNNQIKQDYSPEVQFVQKMKKSVPALVIKDPTSQEFQQGPKQDYSQELIDEPSQPSAHSQISKPEQSQSQNVDSNSHQQAIGKTTDTQIQSNKKVIDLKLEIQANIATPQSQTPPTQPKLTKKGSLYSQSQNQKSPILQGSPSNRCESGVRKPSLVSNGSVSMKFGVELFVKLKSGSITKYYSLGQVLGQGAFGKVWKVTHKTTGLIRAMKQLKKSELIKEEEQKLFSEMQILKNLDHPNIVKLYELYQDVNNYYLVTEYLSGGELFERIKKMNSFSERRASELMRQILMAILYCHENKIVHRDLKPENILFSSPDPDSSLKIIDFGCSRKFTAKNMTKRLGTPYYIAPEVLNQNYNEKCDIWSCGVILYILLCGYPPFSGRNEHEIFEKVKVGKFKFPSEDWDSISRDAKNLISKMLTLDPTFRYSASQALEDSWFKKHTQNTTINKKVLDNLAAFQAKSFFKSAIIQYILTQMTAHQELKDLQNQFQSLDKNKDGVLSKDELIEAYTKILKNKDQATENVEKILNEIDKNQSGQIDFTEFLMAAVNQEKVISLKKVEQAFKIFDQDGDGYLTRKEIEDVMGELDTDVWKLVLAETDKNNDGKISQPEFNKILLNHI